MSLASPALEKDLASLSAKRRLFAAVALCVSITGLASMAQAQTAPASSQLPLTLQSALDLARAAAPDLAAAQAGVRAAYAAKRVAGLRPNPSVSADIENVGGSRAYDAIEAPKQTFSLSAPIELGGKRAARIGVASAQADRAGIDAAAADAQLQLDVTKAYVEVLAADRRVSEAQQEVTIAGDAVHAAQVRVTAGRASPLEGQRAEVLRVNAGAEADRATRLAAVARGNLARFLGRPVTEPLDQVWFDRVDVQGASSAHGETLALAAARADVATAEAQSRLARSQRIPDVTLSAGARRLSMTNDVAAVFGVSIPLPLFNDGSAAVAQADAERERAEAQRRALQRDNDRALDQAIADVANAAASARAATGPVLTAAQEAARIARIGYTEGKFSQLDLLDAERTLAQTRTAAIDALATYHEAQAQLERLTASVSKD